MSTTDLPSEFAGGGRMIPPVLTQLQLPSETAAKEARQGQHNEQYVYTETAERALMGSKTQNTKALPGLNCCELGRMETFGAQL